MAAIFKTVGWEVAQLVGSVSNGTIQLPDLQRPFVWPATKVRDLFDSMYRGYPVGELMFWDVPADGDSRVIAKDAKLDGQYQIIDGQQRLTSLYAAMKGFPVQDSSYKSRRIRISFNPFSEKFEVHTPVIAKNAEWIEDISTVFDDPNKSVRAYLRRLKDSGQEIDDDREDQIRDVFSKLNNLSKYQFDVVHLQKNADKRLVADVFVRINSEGVRLKAYDYILTWLSVFWPEGREQIEEFSRHCRMSPEHASEVAGKKIDWTAFNPYIEIDNGHVIRAIVALGQRRGRLQDAYAALQAKDRRTGLVDSERQEKELSLLQAALPIVIDPVNWREFIRSIQSAGFRNGQNVTSSLNIIYSYVIFLLGRNVYRVELAKLRFLVGRWLFMSQLTARYTGSSESQIQKDLDRIKGLEDGDSEGFVRELERVISSNLTEDFWRYNVPQMLVTSGASLSPHYQCYLAALNILDAKMFMLESRVRDWMDPSQPAVKGTEGHHLFPRKYQENVLGTSDFKRINQVANFAPTDWSTNIAISDDPPSEYWPRLVADRSPNSEWLQEQMYWHALPEAWEEMDYEDFLNARRLKMAEVIRDGFKKMGLSSSGLNDELAPVVTTRERNLQEFLESHLLLPGDLLDPVDPGWEVDAVIDEDGVIVIDGTNTFDSLDDAAKFLGVSNLCGEEFWALETEGGLVKLQDLTSR